MRILEEAARFAAALEECSRRVRRGETLERCLADQPAEYREELAELVSLAGPLSRLGSDPSPEFRARLEQRLLASVDEARRVRRVGPMQRLGSFLAAAPLLRAGLATLAALVVLVGSGLGAVQASASSLPNSPLYQVKEAREWLQLALARDEEGRVRVHAIQIDARGRELERVLEPGQERRVVAAVVQRAVRATEKMVDQALEARARGKPQPAFRALAVIRDLELRLDRLAAKAPRELRQPVQRLRDFLEGQERRLVE